MEPDFGFGEALKRLTTGKNVARKGWNGPNQMLGMFSPNLGDGSAMTVPFLWIRPVQGGRVPWLASQTDMLAEDWYEVNARQSA